MRMKIAMAILLATCGSALASGGANCNSEGGPATIELSAGITRGMGSPVYQLTASIDIADKTVAEDLRYSKFGKDNMAQYWVDGEELKFVLYRERESGDFASVEATIETKSTDDESEYSGTYVISIYQPGSDDPKRFEGKINCFVE